MPGSPAGDDAPQILSVLGAAIAPQDYLAIPPALAVAAILPGDGEAAGTVDLAYAASQAGMERVIARARGESGPVAAQSGVPELLAAAGTLVSGAILPGEAFRGPSLDDAVGTALARDGPVDADRAATAAAARSAMPPIELALLGITAGGPVWLDGAPPVPVAPPTPAGPDADAAAAEIRIVLRFAREPEAAAAISVLEERLATGVSTFDRAPRSNLFGGWTVAPVSGQPSLVLLRLAPPPDHRGVWTSLWIGGTPGFLARG